MCVRQRRILIGEFLDQPGGPGELIAVEAVNHSKDYMAARKVIAERTRLNPEKLADPSIALKEAI